MIFRIVLLCLCLGAVTGQSNVQTLTKILSYNYERMGTDSPPIENDGSAIQVKFGFAPQLIHSFVPRDVGHSIGTFKGIIMMSWVDPMITWDPAYYGNAQKVHLSADRIWIPDIKLFNSLDTDMTVDKTAQVVAFSNGTMMWMPPTVFKVLCSVEGGKNICKFIFGSWTYSVNEIEMVFMESEEKASLDFFMDSMEILDNRAEKRQHVYSCCEEAYEDITYTLGLIKRDF